MPVILLGGSPPLLLPTAVANLTCWLKADAGVEVSAGTPAVDTNLVLNWLDQSGLGHDWVQSTGTNKPTYRTGIVNGQPVVRFDGVDNYLQQNGDTLANLYAVGAKTAFIVMQHTAGGTCYIHADSGGVYINLVSGTGVTHSIANNDGGGLDQANKAAGVTATWYILTFMHSGGSIYVGRNDTRLASLSSALSGNTSSLAGTGFLGVGAGVTNPLGGDIAEMVTYDAAVTESDRQGVERYLAAKYGLALPY